MAGLLFLRVREHRLLLTAGLLAVVLTTAVLAGLAGFGGSVGDAGLRHALRAGDASAASLLVTSQNTAVDGEAATAAVRRGALRSFDGLPVSLRRFDRSGPYALPRALTGPAAPGAEPDLTEFAVVDRSRVRLSAGAWPSAGSATAAEGVTEVAVPESAARRLDLAPGPRVLTLTGRMSGSPPVRIRVTGVYHPADRDDAYWRLDRLGGRGVHQDAFTTYGPLVTDASAVGAGRIARRETGWLATADFGGLRAERIDALRAAAKRSQEFVSAQPVLKGDVSVRTSLPEVLDRLERALLVSRATLLIVSSQLALLALYTLLLVARLLSTQRAAETRLLLARGASRRRVASLAALEALLLALPAALCAPLLAGPLTRLLAGLGPPTRIGLRLDAGPTAGVWLTGAAVALACAAAVAAPALTAARTAGGRARALPAPLRAGADIALLAVAGVAYWQLDRRDAGSGALSGDREGRLGVDPLLVVAPALALLAGAVLTLRLLPPAARLAERRAARGRGLTAPLAGWQLSRRPVRAAGPVLLLVLAVAMGMLAIGHGASWDRSQDDQADFRAGAPVRVQGTVTAGFGQGGVYDGMPGVRAAAPAARAEFGLSGGRRATLLALDTGVAGPEMSVRADLAGGDPGRLLAALRPPDAARAGLPLPAGTTRLLVDVVLRRGAGTGGAPAPGTADDAAAGPAPRGGSGADLLLTVEDRYGVPYRLPLGTVPPDGASRTLTLDIGAAADAPAGRPAGPLTVTAVEFDVRGAARRVTPERLVVGGMRAASTDGEVRPVTAPGLVWSATAVSEPETVPGTEARPVVTAARSSARTPLDVSYHTGTGVVDGFGPVERTVTVRAVARRPAPATPAALATDAFLAAGGARPGSVVQVPMPGGDMKVRIVGVLRDIPTTGPDPAAAPPPAAGAAAQDGGALLLDLRAVNRVLAARPDAALPPTEWWLFTETGAAGRVAAALRDRAEMDPTRITVRDEIAAASHDDPLAAGPRSALLAVAVAAALLAAVGFAVSTVGALRDRSAEFAVLRALGAPRRQPARLVAVEQSLLIGLALVIGPLLGALLTRTVVPLIVLTGEATRPVPGVLVELPVGQVALLLAGVAAAPVAVVAALALRKGSPAAPRVQGGE
ncbi:FtsX-like permease family protein [Streptomyces sp. NPDC047928]|uniref:FtsX-like permease family protein n=1 Tax=unclassified Streptomyces TaxID=2593676 RepID=UPI003710B7D3